jgi:hypothetical protein
MDAEALLLAVYGLKVGTLKYQGYKQGGFLMINEIVNEMLREKNIANQHLLETLGITADNAEARDLR